MAADRPDDRQPPSRTPLPVAAPAASVSSAPALLPHQQRQQCRRQRRPPPTPPAQVARLESEIDGLNEKLQPLDSFVLPGGSEAAAHLHLARRLMRRAKRRLSAAMEGGDGFSESARQFINRASDLLFVAARAANENGEKDVKWVPGANRD